MDEKRNAFLTIGIICAIILVFAVADVCREDRLFSETENRILASRPEFSAESVKSGEYSKAYEEYVTDQFVARDKWIAMKTQTEILLQKKDINGVYLGEDGYLIEKHLPEDYLLSQEIKKTALLSKLVEDWNAKVMLVPTADNVLTDKLPPDAVYYDQTALLKRVQKEIGRNYIDVYSALRAHADEEIYYRTDHHWTSRGAYYGYLAWAEATHRKPQVYSLQRMRTASEDFLGTLHSRLNISMPGDKLTYFAETVKRPVTVTYDFGKTAESFYEEKYLKTKNKYGFFMDDNHAFIEIDTGYRKFGRTLFVIKDSYANSMIPLLAPHYEKIYVADLRYVNGSLYDLMELYEPDKGMDVLVLYNCIHFLEDFQYYE